MVKQFSNRDDSKRNSMVKYINIVMNDLRLSRKIEKGIYNYVIGVSKEKNIQRSWENTMFNNLYKSKILSVYSNLDKKGYIKNDQLIENIRSGKIQAEKVGFLSVYDTFPDNWKSLLNIKSKRDKIKYELKPEAMTNLFKCRKCGSRETSYYEVQTRSADEPMTQFITCLSCNNRWKQ
tara:strand:- start:7063 stop:7596 length:534 start_codon:yes stop_codon:yes gene_type:complete